MSEEEPKKRDVLFVGPRSDDGEGYRVVRHRESSLEVGELRTAKEGKPIHGEMVKLTQRAEHERLFDVDVILPRPEHAGSEAQTRPQKGPAQVASDAYRTNWDMIFSARPSGSDDLPN